MLEEHDPQAPRGRGLSHGKVILLGEHAVVYGVPALAAGIDRGARAEVTAHAQDEIVFAGQLLPSDHELYSAWAAARRVLSAPPARVALDLDIPTGSGLGASAALGVAGVRALLDFLGHEPSDNRLVSAVDAWERVFHGNPSGVDAAAARHTGVLRYVRGEVPEPVHLREPITLAVAVAAPPASTKLMVEGVAKLRTARPEAFDRVLQGIEALVVNAIGCLRAGDVVGLGRLMDLNQMLLASWLVSTDAIEDACRLARDAGALGAKLTGSGGGGCVIALCRDDPAAVLAAWHSAGLRAFSCHVG
ncbi:MAG TPA: mevalonate kinase [Polyangiaceae bacterium]|nr:mevalonate kinase [Polyangiaceae bacterium]